MEDLIDLLLSRGKGSGSVGVGGGHVLAVRGAGDVDGREVWVRACNNKWSDEIHVRRRLFQKSKLRLLRIGHYDQVSQH